MKESERVCIVFVVGLKHRFRGNSLVEELRRLGFKVEIFFGVDGSTSDYSGLLEEAEVNFWLGRRMTAGEIGCALSHKLVIEHAASLGADLAMVVEDDMWPCDLLEDVMDLPSVTSANPTLTMLATDPRFSFLHGPDTRGTHRLFTTPTWTRAYLLNRAAIEELSAAWVGRRITHPADFPPFYGDVIEFWKCTKPRFVERPGTESVISREGRGRTLTSRVIPMPLRWLLLGRKVPFRLAVLHHYGRRCSSFFFRLSCLRFRTAPSALKRK